MSRVNNGTDVQSKALGGGVTVGYTGTAGSAGSSPTATTLTDSGSPAWTTNTWTGCMVVSGGVYGVVLSNTASVLTVDLWHAAATPGGAAGTTPAASATYTILPGQAPAWYMGLSVATRAIAGADAFLTNDGSTVSELWATGGGLNRAIAVYAHTAGVASYTLAKTYTANTNDNSNATATVHRCGIFNNNVTAAPTTTTSGNMFAETNLNADAVLVPSAGDVLTVTETFNI